MIETMTEMVRTGISALYWFNAFWCFWAYLPQIILLAKMLKYDAPECSASVATWAIFTFANSVTASFALAVEGTLPFIVISSLNVLFSAITLTLAWLVRRRYHQKHSNTHQQKGDRP